MTPAQLEHLKLIDAHLERLLAIAEKRTPGEWIHDQSIGTVGDVTTPDRDGIAQAMERVDVAQKYGRGHRVENNKQRNNNAAFIASCAGNAEAGWRATRAAIAHILSGGHGHDNGEDLLAKSILAAFPLELIQKP